MENMFLDSELARVALVGAGTIITFIVLLCLGALLERGVHRRSARELLVTLSDRRRSMSANFEVQRELDLAIDGVARKFLSKDESRGWRAFTGSPDPR